MAKVKTSYVCSQCGYETSKWNGKCPNCGEWNTFEEVELAVRAGGAKSKPTTVRDISDKIVGIGGVDASYNEIRYATGLKELDRVLGGGLVKGSLVLLGGEPGIGKSTMLLQICQYLGQDHTILYVSGERRCTAGFVGRSLLRLMRLRKFPVSWDQIIGNHLYNRVTFDMNLLRSANAIESYYEIIDRYLRI